MNVVSALSDFVDLAPPQSILGLLFGNIYQENLRKHWSALLVRHKCRRAPRLVLARANSTPNGVRTLTLRPTRAASISAPGLLMSEPNARMPRVASIWLN
jgi:hypothetical protein